VGKPLRSQATRDRIRDAARRLFASRGYDRTTIRGVAAAAKIHPSMVMRYYGSKEGLFTAAVAFDLQLPDLSAIPRTAIGTTLVRHLLERWEAKVGELPALLRVAVTHPQARRRLLQVFQDQITPAVTKVCPPERVQTCAALMVTQTIGLAFTRFVLQFPPVVNLPVDLIVERIGATVQRYLIEDDLD
jgi:AcrR family transcriptional regulator